MKNIKEMWDWVSQREPNYSFGKDEINDLFRLVQHLNERVSALEGVDQGISKLTAQLKTSSDSLSSAIANNSPFPVSN